MTNQKKRNPSFFFAIQRKEFFRFVEDKKKMEGKLGDETEWLPASHQDQPLINPFYAVVAKQSSQTSKITNGQVLRLSIVDSAQQSLKSRLEWTNLLPLNTDGRLVLQVDGNTTWQRDRNTQIPGVVRVSKVEDRYVLQRFGLRMDGTHPDALHNVLRNQEDQFPACAGQGCLEQNRYLIPGFVYKLPGHKNGGTFHRRIQATKIVPASNLSALALCENADIDNDSLRPILSATEDQS